MRPPSFAEAAVATLVIVLAWIIRRLRAKSPFKNLPGPPPQSFVKGNYVQFTDKNSAEWVKHLVQTYGPACSLNGPNGSTWLHVYDPKALHNIAIKDQDIWVKNTGNFNTILLGPGLITTEGAQHRKQRKMLTPVFSIAYLRNVTPLFYETSHKLRDALLADIQTGPKDVDMLRWTGRAALELLGQGALGYSFDPIIEEPSDDTFSESVKAFFPAVSGIAIFRILAAPFVNLGPAWFRRAIVDMIPVKQVQRLKNVVDVMHKRSVEIVTEKKAALQRGDEVLTQQVGEGKDVMSILLKANMTASENERLTDEELLGQVSTLILAGMDTTSGAVSRLLHLLSLHPDVQTRLREEILEANVGEEVSYDRIMELPYLDAVCRETLRLYGPVRVIGRSAAQDTVLPLHTPVRERDGTLISSIAVPKGSIAVLNLWACNTNPALWGEDAFTWRPERWLAPLPRALEDARIPGVYSNLMSFHGGGRSCIGFKYAQLEMKVVMAVLLANFKFELGKDEIVWNNAGVAFPTVGDDSTKPEMPLKVFALRA